MAATVSQQVVDMSPSSARSDIVSALLNDYGSFEDDDAELYHMNSSRPESKALPPPPPPKTPEREGKNSHEKSPSYAGSLNMRFQLRVDEPASPESPEGTLGHAPQRIGYKSITRESKPPSLKLLASNGTTAKVSSTPLSATGTPKPVTPSRSPHNEFNKSLPPPPPEKSTRRAQTPSPMGNQASTDRPPRKESLPLQDQAGATEPIKRKPVPPKFTSLLDLKNNPRGGKGGPMPTPRAAPQSVEKSKEAEPEQPRTAIEAPVDDALKKSESLTKSHSNEDPAPQASLSSMNRLPPTPDENLAPPPSSRKPVAGMGLPSNPRAKNSAASPSPARTPGPNTLTPGPTPSPIKTQQHELRDVSPVASATLNEARPFSWEPVQAPPAEETKQPVSEVRPAQAGQPASPVSPVEAIPTSDVNASENSNTTAVFPLPPRTSSKLAATFAGLPSQQPQSDSPKLEAQPQPSAAPNGSAQTETKGENLEVESPNTPFFTPLTIAPISTVAAPITEKHLACYTKHKQSVWSRNEFQPQACMVCNSNERERKWACTWCYLRICLNCSEELHQIEGRDVSVLLEKKKAAVKQEERGRERVRSMVISEERRRSPAPKRHDSGAGDRPVSAGIPSVAVWRADEQNYGGHGYGPEEDFSRT